MDNGKSLFATLAALDPKWAIVEYNTPDLRNPASPPGYPAAYRGLRDMWNFGARYVSPMAWNGSNGLLVGKPGYSTFTAWRNTPLESAAQGLHARARGTAARCACSRRSARRSTRTATGGPPTSERSRSGAAS